MMSSAPRSSPRTPQAIAAVALGVLLFPLVASGLRFLSAGELVAIAAAVTTLLLLPYVRTRLIGLVSWDDLSGAWRWGPLLLGAAAVPFVIGSDGYWFFVFSIAMIFAMMAI